MIECSIFDVKIEVVGNPKRVIKWKFFTDLPCGTNVIVSCKRIYQDYDGDDCVWSLENDTYIVEPTDSGDLSGAKSKFDVDKADKDAQKEFNESINQYSSGIKTPVSNEIIIRFSVGGRQKLKAFGKQNKNLVGSMVSESGRVKVVLVESRVELPIKPEYQPLQA